jgi:hypothetical protein
MTDHSGWRFISAFAICYSDPDVMKPAALAHHPLIKFSRSILEQTAKRP